MGSRSRWHLSLAQRLLGALALQGWACVSVLKLLHPARRAKGPPFHRLSRCKMRQRSGLEPSRLPMLLCDHRAGRNGEVSNHGGECMHACF